jgi:hypothetical protein
MEQRPLRLGDIVDDYCPRERRITNHAIVALVGDVIRQTRCQTCDAEHVFKEAKVPRRLVARKREDEVPATTPAAPAGVVETNDAAPVAEDVALQQAALAQREDEAPAIPDEERAVDGWLAHRPLIRATLPRTEGAEPPARPIPEFTMHQRQTRGGRAFRQAWQGGNGQPNGFRHDRQGHGGQGPGQGQGRHAHGKSGRHRGGNNKRSR